VQTDFAEKKKKRKKKIVVKENNGSRRLMFFSYWKTVVIANVFVPNEKIVPVHSISIATGGHHVKLKDRQQP
jgi:hypothetical protein